MIRMDQKVAAIIPARGNSKGLPGKNIRLLGDKPLIAWSIEAALSAGAIDSVFVSTDSGEIAEVSRQWGAEVPFMRPAHLATDDAPIGSVIGHAIDFIDKNYGLQFGVYITLYPTHPFRTQAMLHTAAMALKNNVCQRFSTCRVIEQRSDSYAILEDDILKMAPKINNNTLPMHYFRKYGLVEGLRIRSDNMRFYLYPVTNPILLIDIDTENDLALANEIVRRGLYEFHGE